MSEGQSGLLVDMGNTSLKWRLESRSGEVLNGRMDYRGRTLEALLQRAWGPLLAPAVIWVASVAGPPSQQRLADWCASRWGEEPRFVAAMRKQLGVTNGYERPEMLGVDRWLAMLAAHHMCRSATLTVDCGTATTLDAVTTEGRHLGGLILPGLGLMRQSLFDATNIAQQTLPAAMRGVAANTNQAIASGTARATASLIVSVFEELTAQSRSGVELVLTGGAASEVAGLLDRPCIVEPDLVMQGLQLIREQAGQ